MNQYQRMICYLYEYNNGQKGANIGYVRLEQRGERCRVQIQMRGRNLSKMPMVAFFRQEEQGIRLLEIGQMREGKGELYYRLETDVDNLLGMGHSLEEMDGIFLYVSEMLYFASSWKLQSIFVGERKRWEQDEEREEKSLVEQEEETLVEQKEETLVEQKEETLVEREEGRAAEQIEEASVVKQEQVEMEQEREVFQQELEAQAVCQRCPFQRKELDYGKRMLVTFPTMRPFGGQYSGKCVRIEPQDLGCLPMKLWSLSGNPFLMQGYCNYRHLLFMEWEKEYAIGVPGIYSEPVCKQAATSGFPEFLAICGQKNCRGAFGYWLMPLSGK